MRCILYSDVYSVGRLGGVVASRSLHAQRVPGSIPA